MSHKHAKKVRRTRPPLKPTVSEEAMMIVKERQRQITEEGYDPVHDDEHLKGELAIAALCYAQAAKENSRTILSWWPWDAEYWKPCKKDSIEVDRERCLVKAGALIYAEIDRLNRLGVRIVNELKAIKQKESGTPRAEAPVAPAPVL